jgi:type IV pilus assembly protein PilA
MLELFAALTVTLILAAIPYSAYRTYRVRAQVQEGVAMATAVARLVDETMQLEGEVPAALPPSLAEALHATLQGTVVESVDVVDGRVDVVYGETADPAIAGRRISLTPYETADLGVVWVCGNEKPGRGLVPLGFAQGGRQAVQIPSTIDSRYLVAECR